MRFISLEDGCGRRCSLARRWRNERGARCSRLRLSCATPTGARLIGSKHLGPCKGLFVATKRNGRCSIGIGRRLHSRFQRELLFAGEHPVRFSASLLALVVSVWVLAQVLPPDWFVASWGKWQASEQLTHFSTLWTVQATLAALVYPIVIAFVTVFLQRRPVAEAFIHLYVLDSGALAAGLSSLALVLVMAVQYVLLPTYGTASLPMWVTLDAGWFLLNAVLTTYFLFRTVEFLRPEVQLHVVRRYAVSVALPRDVMRLNSFQVLTQAQTNGWIPAPSYVDDKAPDGPKVLLSRFGFRDDETQGMYCLQEPARLANVRLWPLRLVVASWMRAARKWPKPQGNQPLRRKDWPLLTVPMTPGAVYLEATPLARVASGPSLASWRRKLLRFAYVFRPVRQERLGIQVKSILDELEADARAAAGRPDVEAFERAYETLVGLHELLLGASLARTTMALSAVGRYCRIFIALLRGRSISVGLTPIGPFF